MSSLRILHVVPYYEQAWAYGGISRLATTLTHALARRGHEIAVYTTDVCDAASRALAPAVDTARPDAPRVRMFRNLSNRLAPREAFRRYLEERGALDESVAGLFADLLAEVEG